VVAYHASTVCRGRVAVGTARPGWCCQGSVVGVWSFDGE
jgi:hypothetical protein